ncbi:MAG: tRNA 2-thiouridine(34) synthase MnmA, partial [Bacillota bacterium]|nr:tRNA 2-thiouridine(34) synthase MnmA [Bacillota bacterium]
MAKTVVLGLSGGVDSAVAARLLVEAGYTVYGHWLDIGLGGREAAEEVAESLGIPFSAGDIRQELEAEVMAPFQRDYLAGRTPLPCARCNPTVKFPALFRRAEEVGAQFVATGHYARIRQTEHGPALCRGAHTNDQAYMLARLPGQWLGRLLFPIGGYEKTQVR